MTESALRLFPATDRKRTRPARAGETQLEYLDSSARPEAERVRTFLEKCFSHYPVEQQKEFLADFRCGDNVKLIARTFELYCYELLRGLGYSIQIHPENPNGRSTKPDFLATCPSGVKLYVEARCVTGMSSEERGTERRKSAVYDTLNGLGATDFYLGMKMDGEPGTPVPGNILKQKLKRWLEQLDADAVANIQQFPKYIFEHDGWSIEFTAISKSKEKRGNPDIRPVSFRMEYPRHIFTWESMRDAVIKKGTKYGELSDALIIALNVVGRFDLHDDEIMEALFGQEAYLFSYDASIEPRMQRRPNGAWVSESGSRYGRVSGVLVFPDITPWTIASRDARFYHNPWAKYAYKGPLCSLPQAVPDDDQMTFIDGIHPRDLLGLPDGWPTS